jgi:hypothetical protein
LTAEAQRTTNRPTSATVYCILLGVDPYYLSQREVTSGISGLRSMLETREDMLADARGGNPEIFKTIGAKMVDSIHTLRSLLMDISATITQVRANPGFFQIDDSELVARDRFVSSAHHQLDEIEKSIIGQTSNKRRQFSMSALEPIPRPPPSQPTGGGQSQLQLYQEEQIEKITETVRLQRAIGNQIIQEIDEQHKMIIELDEGIEDAQTAMKQVTQRITRLIENEGKVATYLVAALSVALIFMLWWVA